MSDLKEEISKMSEGELYVNRYSVLREITKERDESFQKIARAYLDANADIYLGKILPLEIGNYRKTFSKIESADFFDLFTDKTIRYDRETCLTALKDFSNESEFNKDLFHCFEPIFKSFEHTVGHEMGPKGFDTLNANSKYFEKEIIPEIKEFVSLSKAFKEICEKNGTDLKVAFSLPSKAERQSYIELMTTPDNSLDKNYNKVLNTFDKIIEKAEKYHVLNQVELNANETSFTDLKEKAAEHKKEEIEKTNQEKVDTKNDKELEQNKKEIEYNNHNDYE